MAKKQIVYFDGTNVAVPMPAKTPRIDIGDRLQFDGRDYRVWYDEETDTHRNLRAERELTAEEFFAQEMARNG